MARKWNKLRLLQQPQDLHGLDEQCQECTQVALSLPLPANINILAWLGVLRRGVKSRPIAFAPQKGEC